MRDCARTIALPVVVLLILAGCTALEGTATRTGPEGPAIAPDLPEPKIVPAQVGAGGAVTLPGYLLWLPEGYGSDPDRRYPLLIFLHGAGGGDLDLETFADISDLPPTIARHPDRYPFIVLMPHSQPGHVWARDLPLLDALLEQIIATYAVDEERIILSGFSMGGAGVWAWALDSPGRFAALVPMAGYWPFENEDPFTSARTCTIAHIPIWIFHSLYDEAVSIDNSIIVHNALNACPAADLNLTRYDTADHSQTFYAAFSTPGLFDWMAGQVRPFPAPVGEPPAQPLPEPDLHPVEVSEDGALSAPGYMVLLPPGYTDDPAAPYPLMIILHGAGAGGFDIEAFAASTALPQIMVGWQGLYNFIVLMPQAPPDTPWSDVLDLLEATLDQVIAAYPIDRERIYLTGFSMGGAGVWSWAVRSPERFAALVPVAGFWPSETAPAADPGLCTLKDVPVWLFGGELDTEVPPRFAMEIVAGLQSCGAEQVRLTDYLFAGHLETATRAFNEPALYAWLMEQSR